MDYYDAVVVYWSELTSFTVYHTDGMVSLQEHIATHGAMNDLSISSITYRILSTMIAVRSKGMKVGNLSLENILWNPTTQDMIICSSTSKLKELVSRVLIG